MATKKKVAQGSKSQGETAPKAPADVIREAKAKIDANLKKDHGPGVVEELAAANKEMGELAVPMTLNEICEIMGSDCRADEFPVSSIECLAGQLDAVSQMAEVGCQGGFERWCVVDNIVSRMKLASRVTAWMLTSGARKAVQP